MDYVCVTRANWALRQIITGIVFIFNNWVLPLLASGLGILELRYTIRSALWRPCQRVNLQQ